MRDIRILITGGAGFIGSMLIPELIDKYQLRVLDNLTYSYYGIIPHLSNKNFEFIYGDIQDIKTIKESLKNVDLVIHLAAIVGYPACKAQPILANNVNYIGTRNIVQSCNVPIIFASTGSNYGQISNICCEENHLNPITEYGLTKVKAEEEIKSHTNYIIYRFSTGFGLSIRLRLDLLVNDFLFRAIKEKELIIYEKDYWRSFIHVKDIVQSLIFAIENFDTMNKEVYNVGSEELCMTKEDVANAISNFIDFNLKFAEFGHDPDKRNYKVSFKKIRSLGFRVKYDIDYGIKEMIKAFQFIRPQESYYNNRFFK